jgi:23S rRNA (adenine2503-C2)-methyltransferase
MILQFFSAENEARKKLKMNQKHSINENLETRVEKPLQYALNISQKNWENQWELNFAQEKNKQLFLKRVLKVFASNPEKDGNSFSFLNQAKKMFGKKFHPFLEQLCWEIPLTLETKQNSSYDGSAKFLFKTNDGFLIESVLIQEKNRTTLCVSSQVGCAQGCSFCHTGKMGLQKNLNTAEIVSQFILACVYSNSIPTNIVFMGMGEPLDNIESVKGAIQIFSHDFCFKISSNKITVSTVGIPEKIEEFLNTESCGLALSLHSPFEAERSKIIPTNRKYSLHSVLNVMKKFNKRFMIQYTLIQNVNDSDIHANELVKILQGMNVFVNLIPLNEHSSTAFARPDLTKIYNFRSTLKNQGIVCTIRFSKGNDIDAACGQLVDKFQGRSTSHVT